jgi:CubicO group peptidase (beta-lactamase class C family)
MKKNEGKNNFPIILWRSEMKGTLPAAVVLVLSIWLLCAGCKNSSGPSDSSEPPEEYVYTQPPQTGDGWETASLVDTGFDVSRLESLMNAVLNGTYDALHGLLIVRQGKLVFEEYFPGYASSGGRQEGAWIEYNRNTKHECQSATKSFRSAILGIAIDQGFIDSVDEPVLSFFPELADLNTGEKSQITLWHLLTMSSGLDWPETQLPYPDPQNPLWQLYQLPRQEWPRFIFERPMAASPGTVWNYSSGLTFLIKEILDRTTGTSAEDFVDSQLFQKMESSPQNGFPFVDFVLPRDMAKFGFVFLDNGRWKDTQIVSQSWIEQSTTSYFTAPWPAPYDGGYGFLWWIKTFNVGSQTAHSYFAHGHGGQSIWVFKELDLVVVFTAGYFGDSAPDMEWLTQYVLPTFM